MGAVLAEEKADDDEKGGLEGDDSVVYLEKPVGDVEDEKAIDLL